MFNSYEFSFDGESSRMYGLMLFDFSDTTQEDVSFGNKGSIIEQRTIGRIQPLHFGVDYHQEPLQFTLVFGSYAPLDRYSLEDVSLWLTGHQQYRWLSIDQPDLDTVQFRCLVTELKPITHGWLPHAFQATIMCDCPYAYGYPFSYQYTIAGETDIVFNNESTTRAYLKPDLRFQNNTKSNVLTIVNHSDDDRKFELSTVPSLADISVDNHNGIIVDNAYSSNLYDGFNLHFFRLVRGDNHMTVTGNGTLTISGRLLYNVAG